MRVILRKEVEALGDVGDANVDADAGIEEIAEAVEDALRTLEDPDLSVDIFVTDVVMPGTLKSPELARKAKERLPELAVLFTSGYTENSIVHGGRLDAGATLTYVAEKDEADFLGLTGDSYTLLDAYLNFNITEDTVASLTLKNILNKQYTQYLDLEPSPGFSAFLTVSHRFGGGQRSIPQGETL